MDNGLFKEKWGGLIDLIGAYIATRDERNDYSLDEQEFMRRRVLRYLRRMAYQFGLDNPSIVATQAQYYKHPARQERAYIHAYHRAEELKDHLNLVLIASSLTDFYIEKKNFPLARQWLERLYLHLDDYYDDFEMDQAKEFEIKIREAES